MNDAEAISQELARLGFDVASAENVGRRAMSRALIELESKIETGDTALIYFAGHGFAVDGTNYLLPIDVPAAGPGEEALVRDASFAASGLSDRLQEKGAATVILILDVCRDNPFALPGKRSMGLTRGLSRIDPAEGMFVLFSAGQGQSALDRLSDTDENPNSVFTRTLLREMEQPGQSMVQIAKRTQSKVKELAAKVDHVQVPAYYDQIVGDLYLVPEGATIARQRRFAARGRGNERTAAAGAEGRGAAGKPAADRKLHPLKLGLDGERLAARGGDTVRLSRRQRRRVHRRGAPRRPRPAHGCAHAEDATASATGRSIRCSSCRPATPSTRIACLKATRSI